MKTITDLLDEFYRAAQIEDSPERNEFFRTKYPVDEEAIVVATACLQRDDVLFLAVQMKDGRQFIRSVTHPRPLCSENISSLFINVPGHVGQGWIEVVL